MWVGLVLVGLMVGCANPVPPSGGPEDTTPPSIAETLPGHEAVNVPVETRSVRIEFSEYVERSSLTQALSVTPAFEEQVEFDWDGRAVEIVFPESLRDSTTYILTMDTNLSDTRNVTVEEPITFAFATGPRINRGTLAGTVVEPTNGEPQAKVDVYAYPLTARATGAPDPLPERPAYRTQTGDDGAFSFDYMREQDYYVVAVRDANRNRQPDGVEAFAVPPRLALPADSAQSAIPVPWLLARIDTTGPSLRNVQPVTRQRVRLQFNEPVQLRTRAPAAWSLRDSIRNVRVPVRSVYTTPAEPSRVTLRTAPMQPNRHVLALADTLVADSLGTPLASDTTARFDAIAEPDTFRTRVDAFLPERLSPDSTGALPLLPGVQPGVRFTQAPDTSQLRRAVSVQDTSGQPRRSTPSTANGVAYQFALEPPLAENQVVELRVDNRRLGGADSTSTIRYRRVGSRQLGGLEGIVVVADTSLPAPTVADPAVSSDTTRSDTTRSDTIPTDTTGARPSRSDAPTGDGARVDTTIAEAPASDTARTAPVEGPIVVELTATQSTIDVEPRTLQTAPGSTFVAQQLPDGSFRFRAYVDRNGNGRWDPGRIVPYVPAEPVTWIDDAVDSRPRWTNVLPSPLRIIVLR